MKKIILLLSFLWTGYTVALAQLPNGSVAPNFTVVDVNGQSHNLYSLLDQGKTVYLDFFATWCVPCWNYHQTHALRDIWEQYGPPGTGEAYVISIESDASTTVPCISNSPGCSGGTVGDWTDGTPYPIADAASVAGMYQITYYPTIMMVCPADRKVYEPGQLPASSLWDYRAQNCPPLIVNTLVNNVQSTSCYGSNTGAIDISVSGGSAPYVYNWSNGAHTQDLNNVPAGQYTCTVTNAQGWMGITDPITVEGPDVPLGVAIVETTVVGCNGITGSITVEGTGGWANNYSYNWNIGQGGPTAQGLSAGTYTVTVTDDNSCTTTMTASLAPAVIPVASIATPPVISCTTPNIQLAASATGGADFIYQWFASNGGNLVSGSTTANPTVNAAGNYTVQITNPNTTCTGFATTGVTSNVSLPNADAGPAMTVSCSAPTAVLSGTGSTGANFTYLWTPTNGGVIQSGNNTLTPTVSAGGTYTLLVTNTSNGCTKTSAATVTGNTTPPNVQVSGGALTCVVNSVGLSTTTNAGAPGYSWTGPNGYQSTQANPSVTEVGAYILSVLDSVTGCVNIDTAMVQSNTAPPGAGATGGTLTCSTTNIVLSGTSPVGNVSYLWTGPNGYTSTEQNPNVQTVGAYDLVVTSADNGCTSGATTAVDQNIVAPAAVAATPANLNCLNLELQLSGTGSAEGAGITYAWSTGTGNIVSGAETLTPVVNVAGDYNLVVTDAANGCTSVATTTVLQSPVVGLAVNSSTNVSCNGAANGSAEVTGSGGNGNYAYAWSNGETTASVANLPAGTYSVIVTDSENCTATTSIAITQPDVLEAHGSTTAQSAAGVSDGTATADPTGGTSGYTYTWSTGETTQTITGLAPGNYTVVVTDANGCTDDQTVIVNAFNCTLSANITSANISCFGAANGSAEVIQAGGNDPVTYMWNNGQTTSAVSNLAPGVYTVEIIDGTNCATSLNISITQPAVLEVNATVTPESANGSNDGTATAAPVGGTGDYTYLWSNGETTATISGLVPGTYTVSVTDANGCSSEQTVIVLSYNCIISLATAVTNVSCAGMQNGSIVVNLTGGTEPFEYLWSNGATTPGLADLGPGTYTVSITDANGCQLESAGAITEPDPLEATSELVQPVCAEDMSGSIDLTATGGVDPYSYTWSNGATTGLLTDLSPGNYTVTLSDANGCTLVNSYQLQATDTESPVIAAQNTSLSLGASGNTSVSLQTLGASVSDNCAVADLTISPTTFNCSDLGEHEVVIEATDHAGNHTAMTITVTVVDDMAPVVTCPASLTNCSTDNVVNYGAPVAVDNCLDTGGEWKQLEGLPSGSEFPIGTTTQTFSYSDASGNEGTCSFSVTITEPVSLSVVSVTNDIKDQGIGAIDISVSGGTQPYSFIWTRDGQVVGTSEDLTGITEGTYMVEVKDALGCLVAIEGIVVSNTTAVHEPAWLSGVSIRPNPTTGLTQVILSEVPASTLEISVVDLTGRVLLSTMTDQQTVVKLDCSRLPQAVYLVQFRTGQEVGTRRLVVSR